MGKFHEPVLLKEVAHYLNVRLGKKYIDATIGGGGHAIEIIKRGGVLLGLDVDTESLGIAERRLEARYLRLPSDTGSWKLERGNFRDIGKIARESGFYPVHGILYDLGLSSYQLEHSGRGFSFLKDEPLDMRMDNTLRVSARDLVNDLGGRELEDIFKKYGEEPKSEKIASKIVSVRKRAPIKTSKQLADLVVSVKGWDQKIHPATKIFQALRIAVNDELNALQSSLPQALDLLETGGRLVVISFHSLEDRIAKNFFVRHGYVLTKKPVTPAVREVRKNPQARSAKLRVLEKT